MQYAPPTPVSILSRLCRASRTPFALISEGGEILACSPGFELSTVKPDSLPDGWVTWLISDARVILGLPGTQPDSDSPILDAAAVCALEKNLNRTLSAARAVDSDAAEPAQSELARTLEESTVRLIAWTQDMAELAAMEAGRVDLTVQEFGLESLLQEVLAEHSEQAAKQSTSLRLEGAPDLPVDVCCDRLRLEQVLDYLVRTALEDNVHGRVLLQVTKVQAGRLRIEVRASRGGTETPYPEALRPAPLPAWIGQGLAARTVEALGGALEQHSVSGVGSRASFEWDYSSTSRIHAQWNSRSPQAAPKTRARSSARKSPFRKPS